MRLTKRRRSSRPNMDMTPMIDIVFLLIIFFMTVTQVSKVNKEQLELAKQKGSQDQQTATITVNVTQEGEYLIAGNKVTLPRLVSLVSQELSALGGDATRLKVTVRTDQRGISRHTNEVMKALSRIGVLRVNNAVESPQ